MGQPQQDDAWLYRTVTRLVYLFAILTGLATVIGSAVSGWVAAVAAFVAGFMVNGLLAGLFGVSCAQIWVMSWLTTGFFLGCAWGWRHYGWLGLILGAPIGLGITWVGTVVPLLIVFAVGSIFDPSIFTEPGLTPIEGETSDDARSDP